jgi:hypothetical protein
MYTIAAKLKSVQEAKRVYTDLNDFLKEQHFDAYVSRLRQGNNFYVGLIYDGEVSTIPPDVTQMIHHLLSRGQISQLPPEAIAAMEQRMQDKRKQRAFREDPQAYLADLEERFLKASSPPE